MPAGAVRVSSRIKQRMIAHARREAPLEACGLVAGRDGRATRLFPTANAEQSPVRYAVPPDDILRITRTIEREGEELYAIFHSHPATEAYPSATDVRLAFYPDCYYLILSLADAERPDLRAFTIRDGHIREHRVILEPQAGTPAE